MEIPLLLPICVQIIKCVNPLYYFFLRLECLAFSHEPYTFLINNQGEIHMEYQILAVATIAVTLILVYIEFLRIYNSETIAQL